MILKHLNLFLVVYINDTSDWWNSMAGNFQIVILNFCGPFPLPSHLQDWKTSFRDTFFTSMICLERLPDFSLPKSTPKRRQKRMKNQVHKLTWFSSFFEGLAIMISMWAAGRPKKTTNSSGSMLIFWGDFWTPNEWHFWKIQASNKQTG